MIDKYNDILKRFCKGCYYKTGKCGIINLIEAIVAHPLPKEEKDLFIQGVYQIGPTGVQVLEYEEIVEEEEQGA